MAKIVGPDAQVTWRPAFKILSGYDLTTHQTTLSPFDEEDVPDILDGPDDRTVDFKLHTITSDEDFRSALAATFKTGTGFDITDSQAIEAFKSVKWGATKLATIVRCSITYPPQVFGDLPELDSKATSCLESRGAQGFLDRYGSHFIAGQICQSTYLAVYKHSTSTKEQMDAFKSRALSICGATDGGDSHPDLRKLASTMNVLTQSEIIFTGSGTHYLSKNPLSQGYDQFREWQEDQEPTPTIAILKHYSSVIHEIPRSTQRLTIQTDQAELNEAFQKVIFLDVRLRQQPRIGNATTLLDEIRELDKQLRHIDLELPDGHVKLKDWTDRYNEQRIKVDEWIRKNSDATLLKQLVQRAKDESPASPWKA